jgi:hypothetical protein
MCPAIVFTVDSLSGKSRHLGNGNKIPLCGSRLFSPKLTDIEIKYEDEELKEHWKSAIQRNK